MEPIHLSVISPCYNESDSVRECVVRTLNAVRAFEKVESFEHIFIDNQSSDESLKTLIKLKNEFPHLRIFQNSENIGVFISIRQAILKSRGNYIVPFLASDNQDPPELITEMLTVLSSGKFDSVFGVRKTRTESKIFLLLRKIFYRILKLGTGGSYQAGASEYCLVSRDIAIAVAAIEDNNPFLRIYLSKLQGNAKYLDFHMDERTAGKSSANLFSLVDDALNAFSIILPSVFSRVLVLSALLSVFSFVSSIISFILNLMYHKYTFVIFSIVSSAAIIGFATISYVSLIGHYLYILHSEIRKSTFVETKEF